MHIEGMVKWLGYEGQIRDDDNNEGEMKREWGSNNSVNPIQCGLLVYLGGGHVLGIDTCICSAFSSCSLSFQSLSMKLGLGLIKVAFEDAANQTFHFSTRSEPFNALRYGRKRHRVGFDTGRIFPCVTQKFSTCINLGGLWRPCVLGI